MKPVTKVLLFGCLAVVVIAIVAIVAIGWFVKSKSGAWIEQAQSVRKDGSKFGLTASESRCVDEMMTRYRREPGVMSSVKHTVWLGGCLESSAVEPEFCNGVPPHDEIMRSATWRNSRCVQAGLSRDPTCPNLFSEVQRYCYSETRKKKAAATQHE
ncbi:MAG TPA: hypothetical protein VLU46_09800 [Thermoanaerobaculia bacterium]|nr:hypothetical protein [Thermoanaerobaculia bacterium]